MSSTNSAARQRGLAIASLLTAMLTLTVMDASLKHLAARYPTIEVVFMRAVISSLAVLLYLLARNGLGQLRTRRLPAHIGRAVLSTAMMVFFVMALARIPLADATAVAFAAPLFITALSMPLLKEHVGPHRWGAVLLGFVGVLIIVRPGGGALGAGALFALGAALAYALSMITARALSRTESNGALVTYNLVGMAVLTGVFVPFQWVNPVGVDILLFVFAGVSGALGHLLITYAYRLAPVAVLAPFDYSALIWAIALGFVFWGDLPDAFVLMGAAIIVASGLYIIHRETRHRPADKAESSHPQVV